MTDDAYAEKIARMAIASAQREAKRASALRADADECGFSDFYRAFARVFSGTRITYFRGRTDTFGTPPPRSYPLSEPAPQPLGRKRK